MTKFLDTQIDFDKHNASNCQNIANNSIVIFKCKFCQINNEFPISDDLSKHLINVSFSLFIFLNLFQKN